MRMWGACVRAWVRAWVRACVRVCVRACVRACVCVCVCVCIPPDKSSFGRKYTVRNIPVTVQKMS